VRDGERVKSIVTAKKALFDVHTLTEFSRFRAVKLGFAAWLFSLFPGLPNPYSSQKLIG